MDERTVHIFFREHGEQPISRSFEGLVTIAPGVELGAAELDIDSVKDALREVLREENMPQRPVHLARRWQSGMLEIKSAEGSGHQRARRCPSRTSSTRS
jgi:hypothetical protein